MKLKKRVKFPAIQCTQNGQTFYIAVINGKILSEICFVSRRKENPKDGFQRLLSQRRAKEIAQYLDEQAGIIPSCIILSAQLSAKFEFDSDNDILSFTCTEESFMVIDGQHRLFGLKEAKKDYSIPVVIFEKLNSQAEVNLFIDINTKQKGVPTALLLDIKELSGKQTKLEEKQAELFDMLNKDSAIAGYLLANESKTGYVSRTAFNEATKPIFEDSPVSTSTVKIVYMAVKNYLQAVDDVFKKSKSPDARITKTVLFKAVFAVFNEISTKCLKDNGDLKYTSYEKLLVSLTDLDYSKYTGTNKATISTIVKDIRESVNEEIYISEDMLE